MEPQMKTSLMLLPGPIRTGPFFALAVSFLFLLAVVVTVGAQEMTGTTGSPDAKTTIKVRFCFHLSCFLEAT